MLAPSEPVEAGRRVAVVDCGSNSTRLLLATVADGRVVVAERHVAITRLGGQVERTGTLSDEAIQRVSGVLVDYAARWRAADIDHVAVCATSAVRDAANASRMVAAVEAATGVTPVILTGEEEAELTFAGAVRASVSEPAGGDPAVRASVSEPAGGDPAVRASVSEPAGGDEAAGTRTDRRVVCDIGGGSTELIVGAGAPQHRVSLQLGSVRLRERHLHHDPPEADEYTALIADVDAELARQPEVFASEGDAPLIAVAGTATTLAAVEAGIDADDRVDGMVLTTARLAQLLERLAWIPARRRLLHAAIVPGREDVVVAGGLLLARVLDRFGFAAVEVRVADLLDGIAVRLAVDDWPRPGRAVCA